MYSMTSNCPLELKMSKHRSLYFVKSTPVRIGLQKSFRFLSIVKNGSALRARGDGKLLLKKNKKITPDSLIELLLSRKNRNEQNLEQ